MQIIQTTTIDERFLSLERMLDDELLRIFPEEMHQCTPHNKFETPIKTILILKNEKAVACGAFKELGDHVEIKRMFVHPDHRGKGLSKVILFELESWAKDLQYKYAKLETGDKLFKAIRLYKNSGYQDMPKYGPYAHYNSSVCLKKEF